MANGNNTNSQSQNNANASKTLTGARAIVKVDNNVVGIFESCTYGVNIGTEPIHILGRFSPDEIVPTSYEAVTINCSGFRVVGQGVHKLPKMPKLQDLLGLGPVQITIVDRRDTTKPIMTAVGCIPNSYNTGVNARTTSRISITYVGIRIYDEESGQDESDGATSLVPSTSVSGGTSGSGSGSGGSGGGGGA